MASRVTLSVGSESVLINRAMLGAFTVATKASPGILRLSVNATDDDSGVQINQACAPTLFGEDVFVVIDGIENLNDDSVEQLKALLADVPENVWLFLTHPGGMKRKPLLDAVVAAGGVKVECKEMRRGRETTDFLVKEVGARKRTMTKEAINTLVEMLGQDLPALVNAIDQLCSDVVGDPINEQDIRSQIEGTAPISGFAISDSVWERKANEAIALLRHSSVETDPGRLGVTTVMALTSGLRSLILVGGAAPGTSDNDLSREAGVPPWKVKTLRHQWSRWSGDQRKLAGLIVALADADPAMKGGVTVGSSLDPEQKLFELEKLITRAGH